MNFEEFLTDEVDVQKAVVESLAADKAQQSEKIDQLRRELDALKFELSKCRDLIVQQKKALAEVGDVLARNTETPVSNQIALLDRDTALTDRFLGEVRDHLLEVLCEAREAAEKAGRVRRAQILESVLVANDSVGLLAKKRAELQKLFTDNANVLTGPVIEQLSKEGISYKKGAEYLLVSEIIKRVY